MKDENPGETVFLLGAYAKYNWPYVWLRSSHHNTRLSHENDKDLPLDLMTTQAWKKNGHRVWDIVEELVSMNVLPNPSNPFAVDHAKLAAQPPDDRYLNLGAMVAFLKDLVVVHSGAPPPYAAEIEADLEKLMNAHLSCIPKQLLLQQ